MKCYKVDAKCGHVGRYKYIIKSFYIRANTKKEASNIVIYLPRVKHHHKDVIRSVSEISFDDYLKGKKQYENDMYFHVDNPRDQKYKCVFYDDEIKKDEIIEKYKKQSHHKRYLIEMEIIRESLRRRHNIYG